MNKNHLMLGLVFSFFLFNFPSAWAAETAAEYAHLGNLAGKQEKYKEAVRDYTKAIETDPNFSNAYYNRGYVYIEMRKYKLAISDLDKAVELKPDYAAAYHLRGVAFLYRKMYGHAIADYNKSIDLEPENVKYYVSRMGIYFKLGDADKAWKDIIRIQKLGGTVNPDIINMLKNKKYRD